MKRIMLLAGAALSIATAAPANAATVVSENFNSGFGVFTVSAGAPIDIRRGTPDYTTCCSATGSAANLNNPFVVFGDANRVNSGTLSTSFATVAGQVYDLTFRFAVLGGGTDQLRYTVGTLSNLVSGTANNNFDNNFRTISAQFVGTGASTTLSFAGVGAGTNVDVGIDDVLVQSAVPEPSTWAMMLVGFGAVGFSMRRRKSANSRATQLA